MFVMTKKEFRQWLEESTIIDTKKERKKVDMMWLGIMARGLHRQSVKKFSEFIYQAYSEGRDVTIPMFRKE